MQFFLGLIVGGAAVLLLLMALGARHHRKNGPTRGAALVKQLQKDAAIKIARAYFSAIAERYHLEPTSAKVAIRAQRKIREALGEPDPLDDLLDALKTETETTK